MATECGVSGPGACEPRLLELSEGSRPYEPGSMVTLGQAEASRGRGRSSAKGGAAVGRREMTASYIRIVPTGGKDAVTTG